MTEYTGSTLYLAWKGTALQADYRTFKPDESYGVVDASAGSDTGVTYLPTLKDGKATGQFVAQAGTTLWNTLQPSNVIGTLEWGPEGTATNKPRFHVQAYLTKRTQTLGYNEVTIIDSEWSFSDNNGVTETSY